MCLILGECVTLTPLTHGHKNGEVVAARFGQDLDLTACGYCGLSLEDAVGNKATKLIGQDVPSDVNALLGIGK